MFNALLMWCIKVKHLIKHKPDNFFILFSFILFENFLFVEQPTCIVWSQSILDILLNVSHAKKKKYTICARKGLLYSNFFEWVFKSNAPQALQSQTPLELHHVSGHCSNLSIAWANLCRTLSAGSALYLQPTMLAELMPPLLCCSTVRVFCYFAPFPLHWLMACAI